MSDIMGLEFIKNLIPLEPELRFKGNDIADFTVWQNYTKNKLKEIIGINLIKKVPYNFKEISSENYENYFLKKCIIDTSDSLTMPFYIVEPKDNKGRAAIAIHGHGCVGKEGLVDKAPESYNKSINKFNYTYAMDLANKGYTVFVPDLLGAGERKLGIYKDDTAECNDINNALISIGMCLQGVILFENLCLTEFIYSRGYKDIVCCGFSGGGHSALWLAVMSDKINKTVISGFLHSFKDTLIYTNRCGCNFIPNQWKYVDMGDILSLAAPKEVYIETGKDDNLNGARGIKGVYEQLQIANNCYKLFNKELEIKVCDGGHKWYGSYLDRF